MESRNITLTLEKAKEWYNSGNEALKEAALQAYTKEELITHEYTDIKRFLDAVMVLGLSKNSVKEDLNRLYVNYGFEGGTTMHLQAIYKLNIIRKALNKGWNPGMTKGPIYHPYVRIYLASKAKEVAEANGWEVKETFKVDGEKYSLVGGDYDFACSGGLSSFSSGFGAILPNLGLLGCKSRKIAEHMSRYFAKEIFEVCYSHHVGTYQWV